MNKNIKLSFVALALLISFSCTKQEAAEMKSTAGVDEQVKAAEGEVLAAAQVHNQSKIFDGGTGGYHSFRIPSLIRTTNGCRRKNV
jgi:sialidase-1